MRGVKIVVLVALGVIGLVLGTGVASGGKNPSAKRTNVVHVRDLVVNGHSLDGARVPARVERLLRRADSSFFSCPGANPPPARVNSPTAQTCVWGPDYHGQVTCIQTSNSPTVIQTCDATQTNTTQANKALIIQIIWTQSRATPQDGTQVVHLSQTNASGANLAGISQYIKQSLGAGTPDDTEDNDSESLSAPATSADQSQNSHQTVHLHQVTTTGDSGAAVLQFLRQRERASNVLTSSNQNQNRDGLLHAESVCTPDGTDGLVGVTTDSNANQCVLSNQGGPQRDPVTSGHLNLGVNQDYNQLQRVRKAAGGVQNQGVDGSGGSDIGLTQLSSAQSNILTNQNERLVQRALDAAAVLQDQNGPRKGAGSSQGTRPDDIWKGFQTSTLVQTSHPTGLSFQKALATAGHQSDDLEYFGDTSGDIRATQTAIINGATTNWGCPPPGLPSTGPNTTCAAVVHCEVNEPSEGIGGLHFQAFASDCTPPACPGDSSFNPVTGTCDPNPVCTDCSTTITGSGAPPALYLRKS
jgi:hypothetical protein